MDGYAIVAADVSFGHIIKVAGESAAGKSYSKIISSGQAIRIFTGAEIPIGADAVVMQEKTSVVNGRLTFHDVSVEAGLNIRKKGSQIKKDSAALDAGTQLNPAAIGFLSSMGLKNVSVFKKPSVAIIVTGNELQRAGTKLLPGKIFESNSNTITSALSNSGIEKIKLFFARDDEQQTRKLFKATIKKFDLILFTGGISVGDYDFVGKVLTKEKAASVFYKVKQKPGKPLYFGVKNKKYIFGLPGNPASVLTCFYEYVLPAIRKFSGFKECFLPSLQLPLSKSYTKKSGLTHFLKAVTDFKKVYLLDGQASFIMRSYAKANCLVVIPEEKESVSPGELVDVHLL
jgi:molybdopterin molybdotransferase